MAEHNEIGKIGENLATAFLMKQGFSLVEGNFRTRYGEIDIVFQKDTKLRFVEVKTIKVRSLKDIDQLPIRPEDNLTEQKWRHLTISCESYLKNRGVPRETLWQIDLACVYVDTEKRKGRVILIENIHKE